MTAAAPCSPASGGGIRRASARRLPSASPHRNSERATTPRAMASDEQHSDADCQASSSVMNTGGRSSWAYRARRQRRHGLVARQPGELRHRHELIALGAQSCRSASAMPRPFALGRRRNRAAGRCGPACQGWGRSPARSRDRRWCQPAGLSQSSGSTCRPTVT